MGKDERLRLIGEIQRLEESLSDKIHQLAAEETRTTSRPAVRPKRRTPEAHRKAVMRLIRQVGGLSKGGDSVEDMRRERSR
jgi:hypothetical protein